MRVSSLHVFRTKVKVFIVNSVNVALQIVSRVVT